MLPLCFSLQSQPTPHKHTLQLHWLLHTQSRKRSTTKSSYSVSMLQNHLQELFVLPLWHSPMATTINHLLSSIVTRPHMTRFSGACICYLMSFKRQFCFFAQIRITTFWTNTACCYLQICVHVHAARFGDVWKSFRGFAWVLLRCIWDIVRQNRNQMNIDAQQTTTAKTRAL